MNINRCDKVNEYFRPNIKQWDVTKVQQNFHPVDVKCILSMRIPQNQGLDRISWLGTSDGKYTAKSGYHHWSKRELNMDGEEDNGGWARLWKLRIPHKWKFFLWRVCRNTIPVRILLRGKGVQTPILCQMCGIDVEHLRHLFIECSFARNCWSAADGDHITPEIESLPSWVLDQLSTETEVRLQMLAKIMWSIWYARNRRVWEEKVIPVTTAIWVGFKMLTEWQDAQQRYQAITPRSNVAETRKEAKWVPPDPGWYKVNVDASVYGSADSFKVGMVLRDETGAFLMGLTKCVAGEVSVMEAEAIGFYEALHWVTTMDIRNVIVEGDSLNVVHALTQNKIYYSEIGTTLDCSMSILRQRQDLRVQHVRRQANGVADSMAKLPCLVGTVNSFSFPPSCVLELISCLLFNGSFIFKKKKNTEIELFN